MSEPLPPDERRVARLPLPEHQPMTVAEAGLDLPAVPDRTRWKRGAIAGLIAAAVLIPLLLVYGRDSSTPLLELDVGDCFTPVVTDLSTSVDTADCEPGAVRSPKMVRIRGSHRQEAGMADSATSSRREFLLGAGLGAAAAATFVATPRRVQEQAGQTGPRGPSGYRATPHVLQYYRTTEL